MRLSRRMFLRAGAVGTALTVAACNTPSPTPLLETSANAMAPHSEAVAVLPLPDKMPSLEMLTLNRIGYGARPGDVERLKAIGVEVYLEEQLNPIEEDDTDYNQKLSEATLYIAYEGEGEYPTTEEMRPLETLNMPVSDLWHLGDWEVEIPWAERYRPFDEVRAATWMRAVYSKWQLREVMSEFWHNHFNINGYVDETRVAVIWGSWDRDVIRKYAFGNFRAFLEAVASHPAMLYYLNNASSQASPANENYARELFELHTLGSMHYLNSQYNHQREVPRDDKGVPIGYIDEDVYEAARAFTGWTVADGTDTYEGTIFPNTGDFYYHEGWHDHYQKRVLGAEFDPHLPPLADGRKVLDLVAFHPGTAKHLCTKLCRRLVSDTPPDSLVAKAIETWTRTQQDPNQIQETIRTIVLSPEFAQTWGQKVKRPFELVVSFLRATRAPFVPNDSLNWQLAERGYHLFAWPAPNGHPDISPYWMSSNVMLGRWNLLSSLIQGWMEVGTFDFAAETPTDLTTATEIVDHWVARLVGETLTDSTRTALYRFIAQGRSINRPVEYDDDTDRTERINNLVALIGMTPEFQWR